MGKLFKKRKVAVEKECMEVISNCWAYRCRALLDGLLSVLHLEQMSIRWKYRDCSVVSRRHRFDSPKLARFCSKLKMTPPFSQRSATAPLRSGAHTWTWQRISLDAKCPRTDFYEAMLHVLRLYQRSVSFTWKLSALSFKLFFFNFFYFSFQCSVVQLFYLEYTKMQHIAAKKDGFEIV